MSGPRVELELEARTLEPGESIRMVCPFCGGGDAKQRCLSLTHRDDGTLLYHCYRAACGAGGTLGLGRETLGTLARVGEQLKRKASRVKPSIEERLGFLPDVINAWGMHIGQLELFGVMWDEETQRLALPVWGPTFQLRGRVLRTLPGDTRQPKTLLYMYEDAPSMAWNLVLDTEAVVVVEDIPSAIRLGLGGYRAVALNGTHLTTDALSELDGSASSVIWALDRDAFAKSVNYAQKYRLYFARSDALLLPRDFKDMEQGEVDECLSEIYSLHCSPVVRRTNA